MNREQAILVAIIVVAISAFSIYKVQRIAELSRAPHLPPGAEVTPVRSCPSGSCDGWTFWRLGEDCYLSKRGNTVPLTCEDR